MLTQVNTEPANTDACKFLWIITLSSIGAPEKDV